MSQPPGPRCNWPQSPVGILLELFSTTNLEQQHTLLLRLAESERWGVAHMHEWLDKAQRRGPVDPEIKTSILASCIGLAIDADPNFTALNPLLKLAQLLISSFSELESRLFQDVLLLEKAALGILLDNNDKQLVFTEVVPKHKRPEVLASFHMYLGKVWFARFCYEVQNKRPDPMWKYTYAVWHTAQAVRIDGENERYIASLDNLTSNGTIAELTPEMLGLIWTHLFRLPSLNSKFPNMITRLKCSLGEFKA